MIERTFIFGQERNLVGTVTTPHLPRPGQGRTMALLTNAGVIPRIGPHRLNVRLARRLAELGIPTLRFDMSGLGDSRRSSSRQSTRERLVADTVSAMDLAKAEFGCDQFFMVGFCSGGDIAHLTALADNRLRAIALWDSYVYPTAKARLLGWWHRLQRNSIASVVKKLAGRIFEMGNVRKVDETSEPSSDGPMIFGRARMHMPSRDEFGQRIRTLVDRGVEVMFLYSGGEPQWYNYEGQFRDMFESYGFIDRVEYEFLFRNDHTFIQPHAQQALVDSVERWLERRVLAKTRREVVEPEASVISLPSLTLV